MHESIHKMRWARGARAVVALGLLLAAGCRLNDRGEPDLTGPADQGFNLELEALPDTLNADGVSTVDVLGRYGVVRGRCSATRTVHR